MSRLFTDLESLLQQQIAQHQKLLICMDAHQAAMKRMDLPAMDEAAKQQEAVRLRIAGLETRRRSVVTQLAMLMRLEGQPTISQLAESAPQFKPKLLPLRDQLRDLIQKASVRATIAGRV